MKRFLPVLFTLGVLFSALHSPSASAFRLGGCYNEVLKQGYEYHLSFHHLASLTAIHHLNRYFQGVTFSDEVMERVNYLLILPNRDRNLVTVWNRYINPLVDKRFAEKVKYEGRQGVEINRFGKVAARKNFETFFEAYASRAKRAGAKPIGLGQLVPGSHPNARNIDLSLADYLILSQFNFDEEMGSTEVYGKISNYLSYYSIFQPPSPSSVTARLWKFEQQGYLKHTQTDYRSRAQGGSLHKFSLRYEGKFAMERMEAAYLELLASWLQTDAADNDRELRDKIKALK